jgi:N,N'-diacetyllegionaminate synthase
MLGDGMKRARPAEHEARKLVRRGLKASRTLHAGTVLQESDIVILRPATGLAPADYGAIIGRRVSRTLDAGQPITNEDLDVAGGKLE